MGITSSTPEFIGIGVQKSATTWVYNILCDHPEVRISALKEINFFSHHYDHGYQWYERHFEPSNGSSIRGEISPSYFYEPAVPARVAAYVPDVKILLVLRDPLERALSNHKHEVREGHLRGDDLSFERGLLNNPTYIEQGLYATHLKRWLQHFAPEQIHVVLFEDVADHPERVAQDIYRFLNIDTSHSSEALRTIANVGHVSRMPRLHELRRRVRLAAAGIGLGDTWERLARLGLRSAYRRLNRLPTQALIPAAREETRRALRQRFDGEIRELERLIGRKLTHWGSASIEETRAHAAAPETLDPIPSR